MNGQSTILRIVGAIWRGLDRLRRFLHLILVLGTFLFLLIALAPERPVVPAEAALVIAPEGALVDQLSGDPFDRALARAQGFALDETLLKDLIDAVRAARDDGRIKAIVLRLDGLTAAGLSKLQELADELVRFKESGKPVFASGTAYDRNQYFLAAHADEVFMHPMGLVLIDGYAEYLPYFRSAIDNLYIDYNVWTVGEYKSFVEPITRDDMSPEDREARSAYLEAMWDFYQQGVVEMRQLGRDALQRYADDFVGLLRDAGGDTARLALDYGLVDDVLAFDEMGDRIHDVVGGPSDDVLGYPAINHANYLAVTRATDIAGPRGRKLGVIVASGMILDGMQPPGTVGADSMARLIQSARQDPATRALVLRIDSPGGSAFASEVIRRELELFRQTDRPVVVSMGSVAASGGYWIAMNADEIWASPSTLTGSIGVGATYPTFQRTLEQLGVNVDGVGTTELSGQMNPLQQIGDDIREYVGITIEHTYDEFVGKISEHRDMPVADVERSAQGRVWIGAQARERGLVDRLGGLDEAIESAAELAGLAPDAYSVDYLEPEIGLVERLALELIRIATPVVGAIGFEPRLPEALARLLELADEPFALFDRQGDPRGIYAYCFCDVR